MKLLIIICESALEGQITKLLDETDAYYSIFHDVIGKGRTGKKENNPIWPGINMMFYASVPEEKIPKITSEIEEIKKSYRKTPGCKIFSLDTEEIL